ncbi:hypothetical protein CPB83DRAFT_891392 [Crepidotus variabilis]|uniref:LIM zinc-binding domain-containing protein n=1 Tax=Crepidotus variabilis TaxID=179855 RepID=A0A9P6ENB4_9AGAR|nr:hypothetical protein CPB83DRAFT_891392 [Crepidotus variabilis]
MGFCRRCGDIVAGTRCRCGGTAVAPVIAWNHGNNAISIGSGTEIQDKWSKTYVSKRSVSPMRTSQPLSTGDEQPKPPSSSSGSTIRRFPRPKSTSSLSTTSLSRGVSEHILATTSQASRPPSPLKFSTTFSDPEADILPSLTSQGPIPTLSKVYGSVLQPKESLPLHSCGICSTVFPPDATIHPNPNDPEDTKTFLCRQCFTSNGGSKGNCPSCSRPVLALKSEGGFIHSGGKYWHKGCFTCGGCFKNIGDTPMVDLLGRPTCAECFDNCLKRDHPATPKKKRHSSNNNSPSITSPTSVGSKYDRKSREGSPIIEELEQRLGIIKSRENSPAPPEMRRSVNPSPARSFSAQVDSPKSNRYGQLESRMSPALSNSGRSSGSPRRKSLTSDPDSPFGRSLSQALLRRSQERLKEEPATNLPSDDRPTSPRVRSDLSDISRTLFKESSPTIKTRRSSSAHDNIRASPPRMSSNPPSTHTTPTTSPSTTKTRRLSSIQASPLTKSTSSPVTITTSSLCGKCRQPILNPRQGGQFVTIPGTDENDSPKLYHNDCFKCVVCDKPFGDPKKGQSSFVFTLTGPCHVNCAPTHQYVPTARKPPEIKPLEISARDILDPPMKSTVPLKSAGSMGPPSSRLERPLSMGASKAPMPRFGGQSACPGCQKAVSPMERGVVPGPQGTKWHASCLVCGGKKEMTAARLLGREDKKKGQPGCGKRLDSAAKSDGEGGIWCRECLLLIGIGGSPQTSPTRSPLVPSFTGGSNSSRIAPQMTGTTTIVRQFTGMSSGGSDAIMRQLTGAGMGPTRSISPTKQLGARPGVVRPRPKSVIGMRSSKSIDEGRGMFLVRQMTGGAGTLE